METFADVLHAIIDTVFTGSAAEKAHTIIDQASGTRTVSEEPAPTETPTEPPTPETVTPGDSAVPGDVPAT